MIDLLSILKSVFVASSSICVSSDAPGFIRFGARIAKKASGNRIQIAEDGDDHATLVNAAIAAVAAPSQPVNPGAETGDTTGWTAGDGVILTADIAAKNSGVFGFKLVTDGARVDGDVLKYQDLTLLGNWQGKTIHVWTVAQRAAGVGAAMVAVNDGISTTRGTKFVLGGQIDGAGFQLNYVRHRISRNATRVRLEIIASVNEAGANTYYVDDWFVGGPGGQVQLIGETFPISSLVDYPRRGVNMFGNGHSTRFLWEGAAGGFMMANDTDQPVYWCDWGDFTLDANSDNIANVTPLTLHSLLLCQRTRPLWIEKAADKSGLYLIADGRVEGFATKNFALNEMGWISMQQVYNAVTFYGNTAGYVTVNHFTYLMAWSVYIGVNFSQWTDNNSFDWAMLFLAGNNAIGVLYNSGDPANDVGVYADNFEKLGVDNLGGTNVQGVVLNTAKEIRIPEMYSSGPLTPVVDNLGRAISYDIGYHGAAPVTNQVMSWVRFSKGLPPSSGIQEFVVWKGQGDDLFDAAGLTDAVDIWEQPANSILVGHRLELKQDFAAPGLTNLTLAMGDAGDNAGILTTAGQNLTSDVVGSIYNVKGAYYDVNSGLLPKSAATTWRAYVTATGANLNTLTQGQVLIHFYYIQL